MSLLDLSYMRWADLFLSVFIFVLSSRGNQIPTTRRYIYACLLVQTTYDPFSFLSPSAFMGIDYNCICAMPEAGAWIRYCIGGNSILDINSILMVFGELIITSCWSEHVRNGLMTQ
ncbi:hypothetical protein GQ43DRAFT_94816 [Delitschia confertaspora ATCC 74209]|uniref:Uncharacterized protein n=1 Tax=Delitschia confertaspora ATCC 74209 TaxID=1513339 RepID=A0A9P4JYN1_9PLEO|nr:hypothetical protein GQ43DRAFT_94816 [Delitschia confertaspora ATCC 74209]